MFYMSASATTSSSLGSVEMEDFSNAQLVVLTVLMLLGGEIFTSMLGLQIRKFMSNDKSQKTNLRVITRENHHSNPFKIEKEIDLESITNENNDPDLRVSNGVGSLETKIEGDLKLNSLRLLRNVVLCYYSVIHIFGTALIAMYLSLASHAKHLLRSRGIQMLTFSAFLTVSSFANCGFVPTNENMIAFKKDTLLLLLIIPQFLLGNTLFPSCLRLVISFLRRLTRREEFGYLLENYKQIGFDHLFSFEESVYLFLTVSGFIVVQFVVFFWLQWNSEAFSGFGNGEKVVAGLFLSVNTRYSGESVVDLSLLKPALLVLYCLMM
ncbi:hypothetical protein AMTR_s00025p00189380 [Amborella trichopoda]|uniref:Cation transporter HKT6 n=2 Tax=Amborella trichopoda TaxID=13333 RepID=W1PR48_AMBTC|nr:hypothetical protein AMTR_s00025p00189380 [Amborella trichopoda]